MTINNSNAQDLDFTKLGAAKLRTYFLTHLNKNYSAKLHLAKRLPEMGLQSHFIDLKHAILETADDLDKQIVRMDEIFTLMNAKINVQQSLGITGIVDEAFEAIQEQRADPLLCDLSILFYLQNIGSLEMGSSQVLQIAAVKLKNDEIKQLLLQNYDEAKADRALLLLITAKYIAN